MPRFIIPAVCLSLVLSGSAADHAAAQQSRSYRSRSNQQTQAKYVVPENSRFAGSYYVSGGKHYFKTASSKYSRPTVIERGSGQHIGDLLRRLEHETRMLCLDMADNYGHNVGFSDAYQGAYDLWELTLEIQDHRRNANRALMTAKIRELDSVFQPMRREVVGWNRRLQQNHGQGGVYSKIERTESLIHHLINDVGPTSRGPKLVKTGVVREPTPAY
jgi:hypothetical protein